MSNYFSSLQSSFPDPLAKKDYGEETLTPSKACQIELDLIQTVVEAVTAEDKYHEVFMQGEHTFAFKDFNCVLVDKLQTHLQDLW